MLGFGSMDYETNIGIVAYIPLLVGKVWKHGKSGRQHGNVGTPFGLEEKAAKAALVENYQPLL